MVQRKVWKPLHHWPVISYNVLWCYNHIVLTAKASNTAAWSVVQHLKVVGAPEAPQCRSVKSEKSPRQEGRLVLLGESFRGLFLQGQVFTSWTRIICLKCIKWVKWWNGCQLRYVSDVLYVTGVISVSSIRTLYFKSLTWCLIYHIVVNLTT